MPDPVVLYQVDDKVSVITLNRPEKLNAISPQLQQELTEAFTRADAESGDERRVIARRRPQLLCRL